ncbi:hypothetical protein KP79_PYT03777 [Mizuhopecten yessoensis]|uniref:Uncharacterized protein n=1 Tax=Mizuhopecten yessoensis TaxID=6573 RepID=A0A210QBD8_MIZYE|nr:hypothetical protein KP79_PYT03777 [Mizuhopecten yessoensis]
MWVAILKWLEATIIIINNTMGLMANRYHYVTVSVHHATQDKLVNLTQRRDIHNILQNMAPLNLGIYPVDHHTTLNLLQCDLLQQNKCLHMQICRNLRTKITTLKCQFPLQWHSAPLRHLHIINNPNNNIHSKCLSCILQIHLFHPRENTAE